MAALKAKGAEKTRAIYIRHGAPAERTLGVSNADMKLIAKTIKNEPSLGLALYDTGTFEAMYVAGLICNGATFSKSQVVAWAESAAGMPMIYDYTVPWIALEHPERLAFAAAWTKSKKEHIAAAGWHVYSGILATEPDEQIDLVLFRSLLQGVPLNINSAPNRARAAMTSFVISAGTYVSALRPEATAIAKALGTVAVDVGQTACEIPVASERIAKALASGRAGKKRKTMRC